MTWPRSSASDFPVGVVVSDELVLASTSPRRRELLNAAGFNPIVIAPSVDDGGLTIRASHAREDCCAVAWFKAAQITRDPGRLKSLAPTSRIVLSADTVCVLSGRVIGKPRDSAHARELLESTRNQTQRVVTGVCLIHLADDSRTMIADCVDVHFGAISDRQLTEHLERGGWRGRAGGYNLAEIVAAGWPVTYSGDETTVIGLPMRLLVPLLVRLLRVREDKS